MTYITSAVTILLLIALFSALVYGYSSFVMYISIIAAVLGLIGLSIADISTYNSFEKKFKRIFEEREMLKKISDEKEQNLPYIAGVVADLYEVADEAVADYLSIKKHPSIKGAETVRQIKNEKKQLIKEKKMLEYQLVFYENIFPWLEDFKEISIPEAIEYAKGYAIHTDPISKYISPEEYKKLPTSEKNQKALDRYINRRKSNWEAGIEYERYIGYKYEQKGYVIEYSGATQGLEDMGRDLIARKGNKILVIQCKRWATEKTIHEKHIFQLFGTTTLMRINNPGANVKGIFVTTTQVSDTARQCADYLKIELAENLPFEEYPRIKCNISKKDGTKIYHLPFDQQYDRVIIEPHLGEMYCNTVKEAEKQGFRRAYKYYLNKQ